MKTAKDVTTLVEEITKNVQTTNSRGNNRRDYVNIAQTMLNAPDYEVPYYKADPEGKPVVTNHAHVAEFRDATADTVAAALNLAKDDHDRVRNMEITPKMADAILNVATDAQAAYLQTGRKLVLPTINPNDTRMGIQLDDVKEKVSESSKISLNEKTGAYERVSTGKTVTTMQHNQLKSKNTVFPWQKKVVSSK